MRGRRKTAEPVLLDIWDLTRPYPLSFALRVNGPCGQLSTWPQQHLDEGPEAIPPTPEVGPCLLKTNMLCAVLLFVSTEDQHYTRRIRCSGARAPPSRFPGAGQDWHSGCVWVDLHLLALALVKRLINYLYEWNCST